MEPEAGMEAFAAGMDAEAAMETAEVTPVPAAAVAVALCVGLAGLCWLRRAGAGGREPDGGRGPDAMGAEELRRRRLEALAARPPGGGGAAPADEGRADAGAARAEAPERDGGGGAAAEAPEPEFAVQVRGFVDGCSCTHTVGGLVAAMSVGRLQDAVAEAFGSAAGSRRPRLFLGAQELEKHGQRISSYSVGPGAQLSVKFTGGAAQPSTAAPSASVSATSSGAGAAAAPAAAPSASSSLTSSGAGAAAAAPAAAAAAPSASSSVASSGAGAAAAAPAAAATAPSSASSPAASGGAGAAAAAHGGQPPVPTGAVPSAASSTQAPASEDDAPLDISVQGDLDGKPAKHHIALPPSETVLGLERRVAAVFGSGSNTRLRLFYLGRELRDPDLTVGAAGLRGGVVVQVMFSAGRPRHEPAEEGDGAAAAAAAAPCAAAGAGEDGEDEDAMLQEALRMSLRQGTDGLPHPPGAAASGAAAGAPAPPAPAAPSPEAAWRAMAALEEQLSRATDPGEDESSRQSAMLMRQLLSVATHPSNAALMAFAQAQVPDLSAIWGFEPTRQHLVGLLAQAGAPTSGQGGQSSGSGG